MLRHNLNIIIFSVKQEKFLYKNFLTKMFRIKTKNILFNLKVILLRHNFNFIIFLVKQEKCQFRSLITKKFWKKWNSLMKCLSISAFYWVSKNYYTFIVYLC